MNNLSLNGSDSHSTFYITITHKRENLHFKPQIFLLILPGKNYPNDMNAYGKAMTSWKGATSYVVASSGSAQSELKWRAKN